ncbi:hypothetical protein GsuE55_14080 [Geobacillus subterraneus]|uniref:Uncharacterized protein n=1 Tax=Geobacillus subterraneus TaxID=129338 RepID=A0A679FPN9_9BACL|nr:hypothetical protein GsuE55_14080 [Geobacillus subterraneus]
MAEAREPNKLDRIKKGGPQGVWLQGRHNQSWAGSTGTYIKEELTQKIACLQDRHNQSWAGSTGTYIKEGLT